VGFTQIKRAKHTRAAECRSTFFYPGLRLRGGVAALLSASGQCRLRSGHDPYRAGCGSDAAPTSPSQCCTLRS
jgi:hypothetical protein